MNYFDSRPSSGFVSLYTSRAIIYISVGFFTLFIPIFIFTTTGENIAITTSFYLFTSLGYLFLVPIGAHMLDRIGMKRSLYVGVIFGVSFLVCFALAEYYAPYLFLILSGVFLVTFRITYWIPYHTGFAKFSDRSNRSREVALMRATLNFIGIFTPLLAGFIIAQFSYGALFVIGIIIYLASMIPLLTLPKINESFSWTYAQTWHNIFKKDNHQTMLPSWLMAQKLP